MSKILLFSVFVIATCGLIYELIAGALASYLLGDSITQFSTIIGVYLFSMGIGSYLSKFLNKNLISKFIQIELLIGIIGGSSAGILFASFEYVASFRILLYFVVSMTGILVGIEIPILMRILQSHFEFKDLVSKVFAFDYVGALLASLLFPLLLLPHLGMIRTSFLFGILNVSVGIWSIIVFSKEIRQIRRLQISAFVSLVALVIGFIYSDKILSFSEAQHYEDTVVYAKNSHYQRIVLTKSKQGVKLYLNGNLQFSSNDEYRYHESLVHIGLSSLTNPKNILILGGGDGLAVREILKYPTIQKITLVDLDPAITDLFKTVPALKKLNNEALHSSKLEIINQDAFIWIKQNQIKYDFVIIDFPDPSNFSLGKLYTDSFYRLIKKSINEDGLIVVQSTSPYIAKNTFWCIDTTIRSVGLNTYPYHVYVPAFGDWGYILASKKNFTIPTQFPANLKFLNSMVASTLFAFPNDMIVQSSDVNKLNNQILVHHFEQEWKLYAH